jgi:nicotinamide mononucleotide transporter
MDTLLQALQPLFAAAFSTWGSPVTWLEIAAFVLAVWMVVCNMRVRPLAWPSGAWPRGRLLAIAAWLAAWPLIGLFLQRYTDTDVPFWDAFPTAGSLVGQWLLGRKHIENWPAWIAVNVVGVALFAYKGLWLTVLLYALFTVMAAYGWRAWQRLAAAHG